MLEQKLIWHFHQLYFLVLTRIVGIQYCNNLSKNTAVLYCSIPPSPTVQLYKINIYGLVKKGRTLQSLVSEYLLPLWVLLCQVLLSEHFAYPNTPRSQCVRIIEALLYIHMDFCIELDPIVSRSLRSLANNILKLTFDITKTNSQQNI